MDIRLQFEKKIAILGKTVPFEEKKKRVLTSSIYINVVGSTYVGVVVVCKISICVFLESA